MKGVARRGLGAAERGGEVVLVAREGEGAPAVALLVLRDHALGDHLRRRGGERPAEVAVARVVEDARLTAWLGLGRG